MNDPYEHPTIDELLQYEAAYFRGVTRGRPNRTGKGDRLMTDPKPLRKPVVSQMIARIAKQCGSEVAAIEVMLRIATGRLAALGRYQKSLPEGKATKGAFTRTTKKIAPRAKAIAPRAKFVKSPATTKES